MATRLIGTDSNDPWLPDVVKAHAVQSKVDDLAGLFDAVDVEGVLAELQGNVDALVISGGGIATASGSETIAGADDTKAVTPAGLKASRPTVDARAFGVVFDDSTDNTAALQAAVNAVTPSGTLILAEGVARFAGPLDLSALRSARLVGVGGGGQNAVAPATRLVYTGGAAARALDVRGARAVEFVDVAVQHSAAAFTGYLIDLSGTAAGNGTRHVLRRVLVGSTDPATIRTATGVCVDGCYDVDFDGCGFVGLANGVQGQINGGQNFANGIRLVGGYGALIGGYHLLNGGNGWTVAGYVAEPRPDGTPNLFYAPTTVIAPALTLLGVDLEDGTSATGAWVEMGDGSLDIQGGYFRIGGGSVVKLNAPIGSLVVQGAKIVASPGVASSVVDGAGLSAGAVHVGPNHLIDVEVAVRNLSPVSGVLHNRTNIELPDVQGTTATFRTSLNAGAVSVANEFGGVNTLAANAASFEGGVSPWGAGSNSTIAQSAAQFLDGTKSLAITSVAAGNTNATVAVGSAFAVTPGQQWTMLASYRAATVARSVRIELFWYTSANVLTGASVVGSSVLDTTTGWTQAIVTGIPPSNAAKVVPVLRVLSTAAAGEVHYVDCVSLATGTSNVWHAAGTGPKAAAFVGINTVGFNGATPVGKAANPGVATGSDAAVINAIVTALRNLGLVT